METEEFTAFLGNESMSTVKAGKAKRSGNIFAGGKSLVTDFTLVLAIGTIVVVEVMMRRAT